MSVEGYEESWWQSPTNGGCWVFSLLALWRYLVPTLQFSKPDLLALPWLCELYIYISNKSHFVQTVRTQFLLLATTNILIYIIIITTHTNPLPKHSSTYSWVLSVNGSKKDAPSTKRMSYAFPLCTIPAALSSLLCRALCPTHRDTVRWGPR